MLNYVWAGMIIVGIVFGVFTGNLSAITNAALDSAGEGISICITTAGVMAFWMGLMEIARQSGLVAGLTKGIRPFLNFCFPDIPEDHKAREYIATNIIANVLGLGWACTPAGLKAMEELANLETQRGTPGYESPPAKEEKKPYITESKEKKERAASHEMCTLLILNISSLQLIPVNMIAYRSQYGSKDPAGIIAPVIIITLTSTMAAIIYCKWKGRKKWGH